jgi:hypothetical protein
MTDLSRLTKDLATAQITERVTAAQRLKRPGRRRPHGRHALAGQLHRIADRLDG